jgi:hypothetical protein
MIAELFYPRELKEVIAELWQENNLRHKPLKQLNRNIYIFWSTLVFFSIIGFLGGGVLPAVIGFLLSYLMLQPLYHDMFKYCLAYAKGELHEGTIAKINTNDIPRVFTNCNIDCERLSDKKKFRMSRIFQKNIEKTGLTVGQKIKFYALEKNKRHAIPDLQAFKLAFCLRKDLMEETIIQQTQNEKIIPDAKSEGKGITA